MKRVAALLMFVLLIIPTVWADVTKTINYQGRLTDASGNPISGSHSINVSLYTTATGGSYTWTGTYPVTTTDGYFSIVLGDPSYPTQLLDNVDFSQQYYVEIMVDSFVQSPRQLLSGTPFSMNIPDNTATEQWVIDSTTTINHTADTSGTVVALEGNFTMRRTGDVLIIARMEIQSETTNTVWMRWDLICDTEKIDSVHASVFEINHFGSGVLLAKKTLSAGTHNVQIKYMTGSTNYPFKSLNYRVSILGTYK